MFSVLCSIKSSFQLRTFDPEGVIFYGDTKKGQDWFVLSLKDGVPLMQICKEGIHVSVAGGTKLNDGEWHTVSFHPFLDMASLMKLVANVQPVQHLRLKTVQSGV